MGYSVKILKDSIAPCGRRLTTWELTYPRFVHAEALTHRQFSRNSASSRAIPNEKLRQRVRDDPAMPVWWGKNQAGMQAREELSDDPWFGNYVGGGPRRGLSERADAQREWLHARDLMLEASERLAAIGLHKQLCNRLIEPWMFITVIVSATEFDNWFHLRDHPDAQPEIAWVAREMRRQYDANMPERLEAGMWHLPLIHTEDWDLAAGVVGFDCQDRERARARVVDVLKKVSVGRCARVSYLTHDGKRDLVEDVRLHDRLIAGVGTGEPLHMSPFEHVAEALDEPLRIGNFVGWRQYRKTIPGECFGATSP